MTPHPLAAAFHPHAALAGRLLPTLPDAGDGSHDIAHLARVWTSIRTIRAGEGGVGDGEAGEGERGDGEVLAAACLLHDCVAVEKGSPQRGMASRLAATRALGLLADLGWTGVQAARVAHAIEAHSFSAAIAPVTLEARILQDADRLDAIGAIGVARCFYTAGRMGSLLYDPGDPPALHRPLDERRFAIDHFQTKLLHLASGFQTATGQRLARLRHDRIARFLADLLAEIDPDRAGVSPGLPA